MELQLELPSGTSTGREIPLGGSPFPPIADYALLSDCEVCALVAPSGNVEWLPLPRMDGPSVFSALLDRHAGRFRVGPIDRSIPAGRRYVAWDAVQSRGAATASSRSRTSAAELAGTR